MNKKNNDKRKFVRLSALAHGRLKTMSGRTGIKMERLIDDAVFDFLKLRDDPRFTMVRGTGE